MKSSIKIDFIDRGTGVGIEPVIRIELIKSEDPRDTLIGVLFENVRSQSFLQFQYTNHKRVLLGGEADYEKQILLFKPEIDSDELMSIVRQSFSDWCLEKGWSVNGIHVDDKGYQYTNKKKELIYDSELFPKFIAEKASHTNG